MGGWFGSHWLPDQLRERRRTADAPDEPGFDGSPVDPGRECWPWRVPQLRLHPIAGQRLPRVGITRRGSTRVRPPVRPRGLRHAEHDLDHTWQRPIRGDARLGHRTTSCGAAAERPMGDRQRSTLHLTGLRSENGIKPRFSSPQHTFSRLPSAAPGPRLWLKRPEHGQGHSGPLALSTPS